MHWLSDDPDHVFWMRLVLALADGVWVALAGFLGFAFFRRRERARLEEEAQGVLRRLRLEAIVGVVQAWTDHYRADRELRHYRALLAQAQDPRDVSKIGELVAQHRKREEESAAEFTELMMTKAMLLPDSMYQPYMRYLKAPDGTRQRERAFGEVEAAFKAYLPPVRERWRPIWKLRYWIATKFGADRDRSI